MNLKLKVGTKYNITSFIKNNNKEVALANGVKIFRFISNEFKKNKVQSSLISIVQVKFGLTNMQAEKEIKNYTKLHLINLN